MATKYTNPVLYDLMKEGNSFRHARLYEIVRPDTTAYRFTDHQAPIEFGGNTYVPAGGGHSAATRFQGDTQPSDSEFIGLITSSAITYDDLRYGKFENSSITVYLVDWRYPWEGAFKTEKFLVTNIRYSDQQWTAEIAGKSVVLERSTGKVISRTCRVKLGSTECGVNLATYTRTGTVTSVISGYDRLRIQSDLSADWSGNILEDENGDRINDGFFNSGVITWVSTSNGNDGSQQAIRLFKETNGVVWLWAPTQYNIAVGDTFSCTPGCNKLPGANGHCIRKFNNYANFRGEPFVPGNSKLQQTPALK